MNANKEAKDGVTKLELLKIVAPWLSLPIGTLILAAIRPVRDRIWPATPKVLLLVLLVTSLSVVLWLIPLALRLRRKQKSLESEMESLRSKPGYPYKFGVKWDSDFNPLCPHCEAHLSGAKYALMHTRPDLSFFNCQGCRRVIDITDQNGVTPIRFTEARKQMIEGAEWVQP